VRSSLRDALGDRARASPEPLIGYATRAIFPVLAERESKG
jgi:hypothetical protein